MANNIRIQDHLTIKPNIISNQTWTISIEIIFKAKIWITITMIFKIQGITCKKNKSNYITIIK